MEAGTSPCFTLGKPCLVCRSPLDGYAYLENRPGTRRLEVLTFNGKWWINQLGHGCFKRSVAETWHGNHMNSWNCHAAVKTHNMSKTCPNHLQIWATWCYLTIILFKQGYKKWLFSRPRLQERWCAVRSSKRRTQISFPPSQLSRIFQKDLVHCSNPQKVEKYMILFWCDFTFLSVVLGFSWFFLSLKVISPQYPQHLGMSFPNIPSRIGWHGTGARICLTGSTTECLGWFEAGDLNGCYHGQVK